MRVIPVLMSPCVWDTFAWLKVMAVFPGPDLPLSRCSKHQRDEYLVSLVKEISGLVSAPNLEMPRPFLETNPSGGAEDKAGRTLAPSSSEHRPLAVESNSAQLRTRLEEKLRRLSVEWIRDEDELVPFLEFLRRILQCPSAIGADGLERPLADFLMEYHDETLSRLDQALESSCGQDHSVGARALIEIIDMVTPFQIPRDLLDWVLMQRGQPVFQRAAPGVVCAEVVAARLDGQPTRFNLERGGVRIPNRIGETLNRGALDAPDGALHVFLRDLYLSANLDLGRPDEAQSLSALVLTARLRGFFAKWKSKTRGRSPYVVVKLPEEGNDRAHWMRVLAQVKQGVEHLLFLELFDDPEAQEFEGGLVSFLHTRLESVRSQKSP
jgi:hypothetical protein